MWGWKEHMTTWANHLQQLEADALRTHTHTVSWPWQRSLRSSCHNHPPKSWIIYPSCTQTAWGGTPSGYHSLPMFCLMLTDGNNFVKRSESFFLVRLSRLWILQCIHCVIVTSCKLWFVEWSGELSHLAKSWIVFDFINNCSHQGHTLF